MALDRVLSDPKPPKRKPREKTRVFRHVATIAEWRELRAVKFDGQHCRLCGAVGTDAGLHHLIPRSLGGDDVAANLVRLCGSGTTGCHGKVEARDPDALATLAARLRDDEYAHCIEKMGEGAMTRLFGVMVVLASEVDPRAQAYPVSRRA